MCAYVCVCACVYAYVCVCVFFYMHAFMLGRVCVCCNWVQVHVVLIADAVFF